MGRLQQSQIAGSLASGVYQPAHAPDLESELFSFVFNQTLAVVDANGTAPDYPPGNAGNVRRVVAQKGTPSLAWRPASLDHVLGDARLRDLKPELEQLAVDARRSPKRVLNAHPPDQDAEVRLDLRPPSQ